VTLVGRTIVGVLSIYVVILIARLVIDYVFMFAREWRPRGIVLVLVEGIYTLTDPPLKALRRVIPPLRIGTISLDLAFLVLFILVQVLIQLAYRI
jgi:YggT family protein